MEISRFNGLRFGSNVCPFSLSPLDSLDLGNSGSGEVLNKAAAKRVSRYLDDYTESKGAYVKINFVNADHVHALVDLPTALSIEELVQLLKGASSHWINSNNMVTGKFAWGRGYGAFSRSIAINKSIIACVRSPRN